MKGKSFYKIPLIISIAVFSLSMVILWAFHFDELNRSMAIVGVCYALICFAFLIFQIFAFVRAHIHYDEDFESVKLKVFEAEREED